MTSTASTPYDGALKCLSRSLKFLTTTGVTSMVTVTIHDGFLDRVCCGVSDGLSVLQDDFRVDFHAGFHRMPQGGFHADPHAGLRVDFRVGSHCVLRGGCPDDSCAGLHLDFRVGSHCILHVGCHDDSHIGLHVDFRHRSIHHRFRTGWHIDLHHVLRRGIQSHLQADLQFDHCAHHVRKIGEGFRVCSQDVVQCEGLY